MMAVSAETVKKLRDLTGAGMLDCKKALEETGGKLEKAKEILRRRGEGAAARTRGRAQRATARSGGRARRATA